MKVLNKIAICVATTSLFLTDGSFLRAEESSDRIAIERAISQLGRGATHEQAYKAYVLIEHYGAKALPVLITHLSNTEVANGTLQRPLQVRDPISGDVIGWRKTEIGDLVFSSIRDLIEGERVGPYHNYYALDRKEIKQWVTDREGRSLKELRVEAAELLLRKVTDLPGDRNTDESKKLRETFEKRVEEIKAGGSPDMMVRPEK